MFRLYNTTKAFLKIHELIQIINSKVNAFVDKNFSKNTSFDSNHSQNLSTNNILTNSTKSLNSTYLFGSAISKDSTVEIQETISKEKQNEFSFLKHQRTPFNSMDLGLNSISHKKSKLNLLLDKSIIFKYVINSDYRHKFESLISTFETTVNVKESSPSLKLAKKFT